MGIPLIATGVIRLPAILSEGQIPLPSLLLATVLSACLWWGIVAGI